MQNASASAVITGTWVLEKQHSGSPNFDPLTLPPPLSA
jgi:hypothetical protein